MTDMNMSAEKRLNDSDRQSTTKLLIIDHELNRHGMGRYHWLIWAVCGTGFMLDLMWTQAYLLALPSIQREFRFSDKELGNIGTVYGAGIIVGAFVWGVLVDIVGRRVAFYGTSLIAGTFGMCFGAMSSFTGLQVIIAFVGFGTGGNIPIDSTITVEYLPKQRFYLFTALGVYAQMGNVLCTIIAFGLMPNYSCSPNLESCHLTGGIEPCCSSDANRGWRYLFFTVSSITLGVFIIRFLVFPFYESPKFLASKGNDHAAVEVVRKVSTFNNRPCDLTVASLREQCRETPVSEVTDLSKRLFNSISHLKLIFGSWKMVWVTTLIWIMWTFDYGSVGIANTYLPIILQRKNFVAHIGLKQTYMDYAVINAPGIVAAILSALVVRVPLIGRKVTLIFASAMMSISLFLYSIVDTQASRIGFNTLLVFFQLVFNSVLWGWTPEAFPTAVRGTATSMAVVFATLFAMVGPQIGAQLFVRTQGGNAVLYLSGSCTLVCTLTALCLPTRDMVASRHT